MRLTLTEARAECRRYLDHLAREKAKSEALQKLAADRRAGRCDDKEKDRRMSEIIGPSPKVYDGANLAAAIEVMLKATEATK
jgi:hypothetical protein